MRLWYAPALLLLYQTAPIQARVDELGHFRFGLGYSRGRYLIEQFDCAGNVTDHTAARYSALSGQAEVWVSPHVRLAGVGGVMRTSGDLGRSEGFGTLLVAQEGKKFGIGTGIAWWPQTFEGSARAVPAFYLRGGAEHAHFRIDDNASAPPGTPPLIRVGIAGGYGAAVRPNWFLGTVLWPFPNDGGNVVGLGGELALPLGPVQPILNVSARPRQSGTDWNAGIGARVVLGRARGREVGKTVGKP